MATDNAPSAQFDVKDLSRTIFGMAYCAWWIRKSALDFFIEKWSARFLAVSAGLLALEIVLEYFQRDFGRATIPLKIAFVGAFIVVAIDKYREWKKTRDEFSFLGSIHAIAVALSRAPERGSLSPSLFSLLEIFHDNFKDKGDEVSVTLALRDMDREGVLQIAHRFPGKPGQRPTFFNVGAGGLGYAYQKRCLVYIPSTALRHGIIHKFEDNEPFAVRTLVYQQHSRERTYRSILSVPILISGHCFGVLCIDSTRRNAFKKSDFLKAMHHATSVAQILHNSPMSAVPPQLVRRGLTRR
jgi:hypothetical protein